MNDIFKDMQVKVGCEYISDLPSYKRKVWHEMKRLNPTDYEERQLCCLYGTDKKRNQQSGSSGYQFSCGVRAVRFIYCLRSRLHQEDK